MIAIAVVEEFYQTKAITVSKSALKDKAIWMVASKDKAKAITDLDDLLK